MAIETRPKAQYFSLRTPYLSSGRTTDMVAETDMLTLMIKVYASGGENALHAHTNEDHSFIVLEGEATFYDETETPTVVRQWEGIMLPKGAYYWFMNSGEGNLVMVRAGARTQKRNDHTRIKPDGNPIPADSEENKTVERIEIPGKFFGD